MILDDAEGGTALAHRDQSSRTEDVAYVRSWPIRRTLHDRHRAGAADIELLPGSCRTSGDLLENAFISRAVEENNRRASRRRIGHLHRQHQRGIVVEGEVMRRHSL